MKKLSAFLNTPARAVLAVGMLTVMVELLIMIVVEDFFPLSMHKHLYLFDPILLIAMVSPALYFLIFRPMRAQQAELGAASKKIEQAYQEWMAALDVVEDPIFLHDQEFRILRCNKAYQQCAGIRFREIIGQPYYAVFPKTGAPLPSCLRTMEKAEAEEEEEVTAGDAIYRSRAVSVKDEQGVYLYSVHTLEDITARKRIESDLGVYQAELKMQNETLRNARNDLEESRDQFVDLYEFSPVGYFTLNREEMIDKINLTGATLLGAERNKLLHHRFAPFVATEDRDRWHRHFLNVLQHDGQQRCELALRRGDDSVFHAQLDCLHMRADGASSVRVALVDITERKQSEAKLTEQLDELRGWHDVTLGREMRVIELKHEVNELLGQTGQPPRYPGTESDNLQK